MSFEDLDSTIPEIKPDDQPDIMAYSLLRNFVADLAPRSTTPGFEMWAEFRYRSTREINYPRWAETLVIDGESHTVALCGVHGELPNGTEYGHNVLRCSCSLPDYKTFTDLNDEYVPCPAKDRVINDRVGVYKSLVGAEKLGRLSDESLYKATIFLAGLIKKTPLAWPPSDRSDRLLVEPMAEVFEIPRERMLASAQELAHNKVVQLHGHIHPSISLAA
jgi:hypothetical protein